MIGTYWSMLKYDATNLFIIYCAQENQPIKIFLFYEMKEKKGWLINSLIYCALCYTNLYRASILAVFQNW